MSKKHEKKKDTERSGGRGRQQSIGAVNMNCGCGFTTSDPHEWFEHRSKGGCKGKK